MTTLLLDGIGKIPDQPVQITNRPLVNFTADAAAVRALLQAAVNVELFTVPLYMCTMKSIQGTHAINAKNVDYYQGRVWPGRSIGRVPAVDPKLDKQANDTEIANQTAYNALFSVFIDEMLHLQMASNICTALGVKPDFNSPALQDAQYNWICYGPDRTVIPHIIDLKDLQDTKVQTVELRDLDDEQLELLMLIEQNDELARSKIKPEVVKANKYFPEVPFAGWSARKTETDLPLFGTISWMYYSLMQYTTIRYTDGATLWEKMYGGQRDLFNAKVPGSHPMAEYPKMPSMIEVPAIAHQAHVQALKMIFGICDQGEGGITVATIDAYIDMVKPPLLQAGLEMALQPTVLPEYQPSEDALKADYPSYDAAGKPLVDSDDAIARAHNGQSDHYARFADLQTKMADVRTWKAWHQNPENKWTAAMLTTADYQEPAHSRIPAPQEVADALNRLKLGDRTVLDNVAQGAIAGITTVLTSSWSDPSVAFPFPSMVGSGDRMALCWAVHGKAPTLREAVKPAPSDLKAPALQHACQSLGLDGSAGGDCAAQAIYHSCKGSNGCATQGGCGFVQPVTGGGNCSSSSVQSGTSGDVLCGTLYSAPADNRCNGFGGCAVPISASQLYPDPDRTGSTMQLYDFVDGKSVALPKDCNLHIEYGASVYETAWRAVETVRAHRDKGYAAREMPQPTDLRLALPPST